MKENLDKKILFCIFSISCLVLLFGCEKDSSSFYLSKASSLQKEKKIDEAKDLYLKGINENPKNTELILHYGNLLEDSSELDKAKEQYEKVLEIKENHILGLVSLANVYRKKSDFKKAIPIMEKALSNKSESWMHDVLGNMYDENKEFEKAKKQYELAVKGEPNEPEFLTDLANVKLKLGDKKGALNDFKKIFQMLAGLPDDIDTGSRDYKKQRTYVSDMIQILERN